MRSPHTDKKMDVVEFHDVMYIHGERINCKMRKYICRDTNHFYSDKMLDTFNIQSALEALNKKYKWRHSLVIISVIIFLLAIGYYEFIRKC